MNERLGKLPMRYEEPEHKDGWWRSATRDGALEDLWLDEIFDPRDLSDQSTTTQIIRHLDASLDEIDRLRAEVDQLRGQLDERWEEGFVECAKWFAEDAGLPTKWIEIASCEVRRRRLAKLKK